MACALIGQEKPLSILLNYLQAGRLRGAFLLTGPEGIGKKRIALHLAQALNCLDREDDACGSCVSCQKIAAGNHPDIHLIEKAESDITIDDIRRLQRVGALRPYEARRAVCILDNAHRLNPESSNALLKFLEEPPASSIFFLVTDKPQLLFDTVVSRCKKIQCPGIVRAELAEYLITRHSLAREEAHYIAYFSEGSVGRALRLKEGNALAEKNRIIDRFMAPSDRAAAEPRSVEREEIASWCVVLAGWFRDVGLIKAGCDVSEVMNLDRLEDLGSLASRISYAQLSRLLKVLTEAVVYLEQNSNAKLLLSALQGRISALT